MAQPFRRSARVPGHTPNKPGLYVVTTLHRDDLEETRPAEAVSGGIRGGEAPGRAGQPPSPPHWLIARHRPEGAEVLAIGVTGEPTLPVFGSPEGAQEFLHSYASKGGWEATSVGVGELLSLLCGACAEASHVALDPLPEVIDEGAIDLVSLPRQSFVDSLLGRGRAWFEYRYREEGQTYE